MGAEASRPSTHDASATTRHQAPRSLCLVDALPADVLEAIAEFLLGTDVLRLSLGDRRLHRVLSADSVWRRRLSTSKRCRNVKQQYLYSRSLLLRGSSGRSTPATTDSVPLPLALFPVHRDVSFDVSFALVRTTDGSLRIGGVLVGAQETKDSLHSGHSESFAFVDEQRRLHCSILRDKPAVSAPLRFHRWYHLALTYDYKNRQQLVYLDGQQVHSASGTPSWPWMQFAQLGAGVEPSGTRRWRAYRGLIDEFRVCYGAWTPLQVNRLAQGKHIHAPMAFALKRDLPRRVHGGSWLEASCTRPRERYVEVVSCKPPPGRDLVTRSCLSTSGNWIRRPQNESTEYSLWRLVCQCL